MQYCLFYNTVTELEQVHCTSSMSTGSHDSINQEMHHFKPIKSVPRTPPKKLSGEQASILWCLEVTTVTWGIGLIHTFSAHKAV